MSDKKKKLVNLNAIGDPVAGRIEVDGVQHDVLAFNGDQYFWYREALANPETPMTEVYDRVGEIVPSLNGAHRRLRKPQCFAVLMIGAAGIDEIGDLFPNAAGPETPTSPG